MNFVLILIINKFINFNLEKYKNNKVKTIQLASKFKCTINNSKFNDPVNISTLIIFKTIGVKGKFIKQKLQGK